MIFIEFEQADGVVLRGRAALPLLFAAAGAGEATEESEDAFDKFVLFERMLSESKAATLAILKKAFEDAAKEETPRRNKINYPIQSIYQAHQPTEHLYRLKNPIATHHHRISTNVVHQQSQCIKHLSCI